MKKLLFFAAATAVALSSCSENEVFETPDALKSEIQLSTYVGTTTKATATDALSFTKFTLYAYQAATSPITAAELGETAYITETEVTRTAGTSGTDDSSTTCSFDNGPYYWPSAGYLNFYAFAPVVSSALVYDADGNTTTPAPTLEYTVPTDMSNQIDLLVATPQSVACTGTNTDAVALAFAHALTQIQFSVAGTGEKFDYYVTSIKINKVVNKNTYTLGAGWETLSAAGTTSYTYYSSTNGVAQTGVASPSADTATNIVVTDGVLMLLPQPKGVEIEVEYYVTAKGASTRLSDYTGSDSKTFTTTADWSAAQNIKYALVLTNDVTPISVTASLSAWPTTATSTTVTPVTPAE